MTYAPFIGWALFAGVAAVPLWKMLTGLIEWEDRDATGAGRKVTIGGTTAIATIGALGALYFVGAGAGVVVSGGGGVGLPPAGVGNVPAAPTADAFVPNDSQAIFVTSDYSGDGSHSSTIVHVDTLDGDWSTLTYADTVDANDLTRDTTTGMVSGQHLKARFKHVDENGESAWSDSVVFVTADWASNWDFSTGNGDTIMLDGASSATQNWDSCMGQGGPPACYNTDSVGRIVAADAGLGTHWPTKNAYHSQYRDQFDTLDGPNVGSVLLVAYNEGENRWPVMGPVGDTLWYRVVFRNHFSNGQGANGRHHVHWGSQLSTGRGPYVIYHRWEQAQGDTVRLLLTNETRGISSTYGTWVPTFQTLTMIVGIERTHTDSAWYAVANVYDSAGTLIKEATDFVADGFGNLLTADLEKIHLEYGDSSFARLENGNNDPSDYPVHHESFDSAWVYYTGWAVSVQGPPSLVAPPGGD